MDDTVVKSKDRATLIQDLDETFANLCKINLKVTKMLVDGRAGLNLISPAVVKKLQIPGGDLKETGTFQWVKTGRSQPKGKVTLPVTFGSELNHRMERIVFDVAEIPLP